MNVATKQELMNRVIRAIERDDRSSQSATTTQLRQASDQLAGKVRKLESAFHSATQAKKVGR